jgi:hypothetical protein
MAERHAARAEGPDPGEVVAALQSALQAMIDAARGVLDVAERLVHDPDAAAKATELAEGVLAGLSSLRPSTSNRNDDGDDDLERIDVE